MCECECVYMHACVDTYVLMIVGGKITTISSVKLTEHNLPKE